MERETATIALEAGEARILAATLWSDFAIADKARVPEAMAEAGRRIVDYHRIGVGREFLTPRHTLEWHWTARRWLEQELSRPFDGETVVVTHHAPARGSIEPRFAGSLLNGAFVSDLEDLIEETQPVLWVHGHTHYNVDYRIGRTRIVSNQRGYVPDEPCPDFRSDFVVTV